jgi:hypothetical protein
MTILCSSRAEASTRLRGGGDGRPVYGMGGICQSERDPEAMVVRGLKFAQLRSGEESHRQTSQTSQSGVILIGL